VSLPLKDFRLPIPESVHLWLEAEASAFGKDMQVVAREILKDWARRKAHAYKVATKRMQANGLQMDLVGDDEEEHGATRNGGRK
jgi:hypothetical protein